MLGDIVLFSSSATFPLTGISLQRPLIVVEWSLWRSTNERWDVVWEVLRWNIFCFLLSSQGAALKYFPATFGDLLKVFDARELGWAVTIIYWRVVVTALHLVTRNACGSLLTLVQLNQQTRRAGMYAATNPDIIRWGALERDVHYSARGHRWNTLYCRAITSMLVIGYCTKWQLKVQFA